jgi:hypothetical protein
MRGNQPDFCPAGEEIAVLLPVHVTYGNSMKRGADEETNMVRCETGFSTSVSVALNIKSFAKLHVAWPTAVGG